MTRATITRRGAILLAVAAAALYALNAPVSKLLLDAGVGSSILAALLYIGAGIGMLAVWPVRRRCAAATEQPLGRSDLPYTLGMVALDVAAPICLMLGLRSATAANASLLNNFEIVATSLIALAVFREKISRRLWTAIALVTAASVLLTFESEGGLEFSLGSVFVLLACVCWGFENNCTRALSQKDPVQIVAIKGLGSGCGALLVALLAGESIPAPLLLASALTLGFVAYGLSILCYIYAQRILGAARTSTWYAIAPFIGAALSLLLFRQLPSPTFLIALAVMAAGAYMAVKA